jgi:hypothetical protein
MVMDADWRSPQWTFGERRSGETIASNAIVLSEESSEREAAQIILGIGAV